MAGQIVNRGNGTWMVRIYMGEDKLTGKRTYVNKTVRGTRKDAEAYLAAQLNDKAKGRFVPPVKLTVGDYLDRWLKDAAQPKLRERTFVDYTELLDRYVRKPLGKLTLEQLTPLGLQAFYGDLREKRGLGTPSVRKLHVVLSSSLEQAVRWALLASNPAASVQLPRQQCDGGEERLEVMTPEEAQSFLSVARATQWGPVFSLALGTGMRPSEYLALLWKDIDWATARVAVQRSLYRPRKGGDWRFEALKTRGSYRSITLPAGLLQDLRQHAQAQPPVPAGQPDLVFRTLDGQPYDSNKLRTRLRPLLHQAGVNPGLTLYGLRHTHATIMLAQGTSPKVMAERLGHASVQMTLNVYSHVIPSMQSEVARQLDTLLYSAPREPE